MNRFLYCPYDGSPIDPGDVATGRRPRCGRCGFVDYENPRPCVAVLIVGAGRVLLARRAVEPARGAWDVPGGFIDKGETAEEAVVRESREETTLEVRVAGYLGSLTDVYGERGWPTLNLCFLAEVVSGVPAARSDVEELQWFEGDRLPERMAFPHQKQLLQWARARLAGRITDTGPGRP